MGALGCMKKSLRDASQFLWDVGLAALIYTLTLWVSSQLFAPDTERFGLMPIWAASGIGFGLAWHIGFRSVWGIFIGGVFFSYASPGAWDFNFPGPILNALEGYATVWVMRRGAGREADFAHVRGALWFFLAAFFTTGLHGLIDAVVVWFKPQHADQALNVLWVIWLTNGLGLLLFGPMCVACSPGHLPHWPLRRWLTLLAVVLIALVLGVVLFNAPHTLGEIQFHPLVFLFLPITVFCAFRLGLATTTAITALIAIITITGTLHSRGPFHGEDAAISLYNLQLYLLMLGAAPLLFAAMFAGIRRAKTKIQNHVQLERQLYNELDHRVRSNLQSLLSMIQLAEQRQQNADELAQSLQSRVQAMANIHALLSGKSLKTLSLQQLLATFLPPGASNRIRSQGPHTPIPHPKERPLGMIFHELITNANQHGVLKHPDGFIDIQWKRIDPQYIQIDWNEMIKRSILTASAVAVEQSKQAQRTKSTQQSSAEPVRQVHDASTHHAHFAQEFDDFNPPKPWEKAREGIGLTLVRNLCQYELDGHATLHITPQGTTHQLVVHIEQTSEIK